MIGDLTLHKEWTMVWKCRSCGRSLGIVLAGLLLVKYDAGEIVIKNGDVKCGCGRQQRFVARRAGNEEKEDIAGRDPARLDSLVELGYERA